MKLLITLLFFVSLCPLWSHPADTSSDGLISANELAVFAGTSPDPNLLQQANNIFQLGENGSYTTATVANETIYLPANSAYQFVALESYHAPPFSSVILGDLPATNGSWRAFGSTPSQLARYLPLALAESNGTWSLGIPALPGKLQTGARLNIFLVPEDTSPSSTDRVEAGQLSIAPTQPTNSAGAMASFLADLDEMVATLETLTGVDYSDFFVSGQKSLDSIADPFLKLEIGLVCVLQDPQLEGGLRHSLALINEIPELAADFNAALDLITNQHTSFLCDAISQFNTQFDGLVLTTPGDFTKSSNSLSATELLDQMLAAEVAKTMLDHPMFGPGAGAANTALGFAGLPGKIVSGSVGMTTAILQARYSYIAFQNPSSAKITATLSKTTFYQDECDAMGTWTATAEAKSKEFLADKAILDLALSGVGAADAAADTIKVANALGKGGKLTEARKVLNEVESFDGRDLGAAASQFGAAESLKAQYDASPTSNVVRFPKKTWKNIRFDENTAQLSANPAGNITTSGNSYTPNKIGDTRVLVRVKDGLYSVGVDSSKVVTISLLEASARVEGCPGNFTPGQSYPLVASLENVANPATASFTWSTQWGSLTNPVVSNGRSTVIWTAPDPAPNGPVTITATSNEALCLPPNSPAPQAFCVTQKNGDFVLEVNPQKGCYDLGETVTLTFRNLADPGDNFDTNFELAGGVGTLTKTSSNTATFTSENTTNATILASVVGSPNIFSSVTLSFGCGDFSVKIVQPGDEEEADPWIMSFSLGESDGITFQVPGTVTDDGSTITFEFTATTHRNSLIFEAMQANYQDKLSNYQAALETFQNGGGENPGRAPVPPQTGDVGLYFFDTVEEYEDWADDSPFNDSEFIYNVPNFNFTISFPYTRVPGPLNVPGVFESNTLIFTEPGSVTTVGGPAGEYQLDPIVSATEVITLGNMAYEIFFVPSTN